MGVRDFLPRSFLNLPEEDDEATVGRGWNRLLGDPIRLGDAVGRRRPNQPEDVATVETLLRQTGDLDFRPEHAPTGLFGLPLDNATRRFQRRNRLADDGIVNPDGETFQALEDESFTGDDADRRRQQAKCNALRVQLGNLDLTIERQRGRIHDAERLVSQLSAEAEELLAAHDAQIGANIGFAILPGLNALRLGKTVVEAMRKFIRSLGEGAASTQTAAEQAREISARVSESIEDLEARRAELDEMFDQRRTLAARRRELGCS